MINKRRTGYCRICDSNVVHTRTFDNRFAWQIDRLTLGMFGLWHLVHMGPWRCVDCGHRQLLIRPNADARRRINEKQGAPDETAPVANFIRTQQSLVHTLADTSQYSDKYRAGVVQKLLNGESTVSRVCAELQISELDVQQWIRAWVETELTRAGDASRLAAAGTIVPAGNLPETDDDRPLTWDRDIRPGRVIESQVVRKRT
jgi:transposase-like protein